MLTIIRAGITTGGTNLPFIAQIPRWFPGDPRPQFWPPASASTDVSTVLGVHSMRCGNGGYSAVSPSFGWRVPRPDARRSCPRIKSPDSGSPRGPKGRFSRLWPSSPPASRAHLKPPEGLAVLHRMVETADLLVENFRPPLPARLGSDYPPLKAINPGLIYCGLTGYALKRCRRWLL